VLVFVIFCHLQCPVDLVNAALFVALFFFFCCASFVFIWILKMARLATVIG